MRGEFVPVKNILDVTEIFYCSTCLKAAPTARHGHRKRCILSELNLATGLPGPTKILNYGYYQCFLKNCSYSAVLPYRFIQHLAEHGISLNIEDRHRYNCKTCGYGTTQKRYLDNHELTCGNEVQESDELVQSGQTIDLDSESLEHNSDDSQPELSIPITTVERPSSHKYICTNCSYSTTQQRYLLSHQLTCNNSNPQPSEDPTLESPHINAAENLSGQRDYIENESVGGRNQHKYRCTNCNYSTTQGRYLKSHEIQCRGGSSSTVSSSSSTDIFKCDACSYVAVNYWGLKVHEQSHKQVECESPGQSGDDEMTNKDQDDQENVSVHENVVNNQRFHCKFCGFKASNMLEYARHCRYCVLRKKDHQSLSTFKKRKMNMVMKNKILSKIIVKKEFVLECDQCDFVARNPTGLQKHRLAHLLFGTTTTEDIVPLAPKLSEHYKHNEEPSGMNSVDSSQCNQFNKYQCPKCTYKATNSISFACHKKLCGVTTIDHVRCETCGYVATYKYSLKRHRCLKSGKSHKAANITGVTPDNVSITQLDFRRNRFCCDLCHFSSNSTLRINSHRKICDDPRYEKFRCKVCYYKTTRNTWLANHMKQHSTPGKNDKTDRSSQKEYILPTSRSTVAYVDTLNTDDNVSKLLNCQKCPFKTSSMSGFKSHRDLCGADGITTYQCPTCHYLTVFRGNLIIHVKRYHSMDKTIAANQSYTCEKCNELVSFRNSDKHTSRCGRAEFEKYRCSKYPCGFIGLNSNSILVHFAKAHVVQRKTTTVKNSTRKNSMNTMKKRIYKTYKFDCDKCPFTCGNQATFHKHINACQAKSCGIDVFSCDYSGCHFVSLTEQGLNAHQRSNKVQHKNINQNVSTLQNESLKLKESILTGKTTVPLKCDTCPFTSQIKAQLKKHMILCEDKIRGVIMFTCKYSGCHFIALKAHGIAIHTSKHHEMQETHTQKNTIDQPTVEDTSSRALEQSSSVTQSEDSAMSHSQDPKKTHDQILPSKEARIYKCGKCSFRCEKSALLQIESHKLNCRTKLFDKFSCTNFPVSPTKTSAIDTVTPIQSVDLPEYPSNKTSELQDTQAADIDDPMLCIKNEHQEHSEDTRSPDAPHTSEPLSDLASSSINNDCDEQTEIDQFDSESYNELSLCLDSEYFI